MGDESRAVMTSEHLLVLVVWALLGLAAVGGGGCSNRALEPRLRDQAPRPDRDAATLPLGRDKEASPPAARSLSSWTKPEAPAQPEQSFAFP